MQPIPELPGIDSDTFLREVVPCYQPVVLRGQVSTWPAVAAGLRGPRAMADYIGAFDCGRPASVMVGAPEIEGRYFYSDDVQGLNFHRETVPLPRLLDKLLELIEDPHPPSLYASAAATSDHLPGWDSANRLALPVQMAMARIWIGNRARARTHFDVSSNIACVVAGRRRFTLFPPQQIANLYVGPFEHTLAGQPTSMVDPERPDLSRYPRFAEALQHALVAELSPGDAIFIPALWWHDVVALEPLNVLVNYWWGQQADTPAFPALVHALMSIRDVSRGERDAWKAWFDHYIFSSEAGLTADHLPPNARGVLGAPSAGRTKHIKQFLIKVLSM
jgi:Cupin-like domain